VLAVFRVEGGMALMLNGWIKNFNAFVNSKKNFMSMAEHALGRDHKLIVK
jgi:hypothetical protein